MKFGNASFSGKFVLGPMAGYTDMAFRLLCRRAGAAMAFTEFANAIAICRKSKAALKLIQTCKEEMPAGIQIFGPDEYWLAQACREISQLASSGYLHAACIDLNFGCPAPSVVKAKSGAYLLQFPKKIGQIVQACVKASQLPITCKIRAGWSYNNVVEIAKIIQQSGAQGITVHWRLAKENRRLTESWKRLEPLKGELAIPVIGNGGAYSPQDAVRLLEETGCDAYMISSAALGNPAIFAQANALLERKPMPACSHKDKLGYFFDYVKCAQQLGILSPKRMKAHALCFLKGIPDSKKAKILLSCAKTEEEILEIMQSFYKK
ncbi:MAG: tRNA-dihydrouridine synthase family protein [Candidatus Micrarchaeota archaeon]|nr:tRNA-dihydrouridine synthase family protein [Candidatus Micrarchaeota archaeon]